MKKRASAKDRFLPGVDRKIVIIIDAANEYDVYLVSPARAHSIPAITRYLDCGALVRAKQEKQNEPAINVASIMWFSAMKELVKKRGEDIVKAKT